MTITGPEINFPPLFSLSSPPLSPSSIRVPFPPPSHKSQPWWPKQAAIADWLGPWGIWGTALLRGIAWRSSSTASQASPSPSTSSRQTTTRSGLVRNIDEKEKARTTQVKVSGYEQLNTTTLSGDVSWSGIQDTQFSNKNAEMLKIWKFAPKLDHCFFLVHVQWEVKSIERVSDAGPR